MLIASSYKVIDILINLFSVDYMKDCCHVVSYNGNITWFAQSR